jgi:hypothetical protein
VLPFEHDTTALIIAAISARFRTQELATGNRARGTATFQRGRNSLFTIQHP